MTYYHAVMLDECGDEFGAGVDADTRDEARFLLRENYPENRGIVQLESPEDTREREQSYLDSYWSEEEDDDEE